MPSNNLNSRSCTSLDIELPTPTPTPPALDIDLGTMAAEQVLDAGPGARFQPTLSQVACDPSRLRLRWPTGSRPGYHGRSGGNWMQVSRVGFGERTIGGM